jgi:putative heme-binding domain-containing protein
MMMTNANAKESVPTILDFLTSIELRELDIGQALTAVLLFEQCRKLDPATFQERRKLVAAYLIAGGGDRKKGLEVSPFGTSVELRRRLAKLLGEIDEPSVATAFIETIGVPLLKSSVQEDRIAGLLALRNQKTGWTIETRRLYFATLQDGSRFVGGQGMPTFIDRFRKEAVATLTEAEKTALGDLIEPPKLVEEPLPPGRPVVKKWTLAELAPLFEENPKRSAEQAGDAKRGAAVFRTALCARCHRAGLNGPAVGPDLTVVARRFSRRDMLDSIVRPSHAVAEQYRNAEVTTESGLVHVGRVVSEGDFRSPKFKLNTDPLRPSQVVELDKQEIAEYRTLETSPMPQGLIDTLTLAEIADLLAFLESGIAE